MGKETVEEVIPPGQPLPDKGNPDIPVAPVPKESEIQYGYAIGLRENDEITFKFLGNKQGIAQLLGLHAIAGEWLQKELNEQYGLGFTGKCFDKVIVKLNKVVELLNEEKKL